MRASLSVHLLLRWGDVVLQAVRVSPPRRFVLGESGDWELPADALGGPRLELLTVEDGHTVLSLATRGACVLREGARRRVELGPFSIDVEATCAESSPWVRSPLGLGPPAHHLLSAGVHLGLLAAFGSYPSPSAEDLDATGARDRAALLTGLLGRSDVDAVESPGPHDDGESVATGSRDERKTAGGTGEPAQTEEGALGNPVTRATRGHVGVQGPHDALDPRLARAAEEPLPETWPELVWLRVPAPDPDAPVAVWGRTLSEGTDAASARAPMWGGTIEAAMGPGGLGLSGTGEGGGFHAVAIGLGTFGLGEGRGTGSSGTSGVGHGLGGCGCGDGVSEGHGRLGGSHAVHAPQLRTDATSVNGRLPPEVIQHVVRSNMGRFRACYEQSLRPQPSLQGRVTTKFAIARDGTVPFAVDAGSDVPDASLIACIGRAFESLSFPPPEAGIVTVVYPLTLSPGE
ncbi:MAG TPA: AgmX/PglI C-terminal domain-containing protein [Polyangiaceae bacterium]